MQPRTTSTNINILTFVTLQQHIGYWKCMANVRMPSLYKITSQYVYNLNVWLTIMNCPLANGSMRMTCVFSTNKIKTKHTYQYQNNNSKANKSENLETGTLS